MTLRKTTFEAAKAQFTNRFTMEHTPNWSFKKAPNGRHYAPQYATDREWYDNTLFHGDQGHDESRKYCSSRNQTWPLGEWLDKPYRKVPVAA